MQHTNSSINYFKRKSKPFGLLERVYMMDAELHAQHKQAIIPEIYCSLSI